MQLRDLNEVYDGLRQQGVGLHLISAETGGDAEVKARLAARNTDIPIPVHSDPEHKLLLSKCGAEPGSDEEHSLFVKKQILASTYGGTYQDYMMTQPALVVVDKSGAVQQMWSWRTEPLNELEPQEEMTIVLSMGGAPLVSVRPLSSDLGPSIKEGRNVKLLGKGMMSIMVEMFKVKSFAEFKGTIVRVMKSFGGLVKSVVSKGWSQLKRKFKKA
jgi:peroxiredoxin